MRFSQFISFRSRKKAGRERDVSKPLDTGYAYTNTLLGVFNSYTASSDVAFHYYRLGNMEWFAQDNWKLTRRLTIDFGVRPQNLISGFDTSRFNPVKEPRLVARYSFTIQQDVGFGAVLDGYVARLQHRCEWESARRRGARESYRLALRFTF